MPFFKQDLIDLTNTNYDSIADLALGLEHLDQFIAKQLLQIFCYRTGAFGERAAAGKTTVGGDQVQMGIKLLKITKGVNGDGRASNGIIERD